jgi:hypothetical protein
MAGMLVHGDIHFDGFASLKRASPLEASEFPLILLALLHVRLRHSLGYANITFLVVLLSYGYNSISLYWE